MWSKLKVRISSALVGAAFVLVLIFSSPWVFYAAIAITCFFVLFELYNSFWQKKIWQLLTLDYIFAALMAVAPFISRSIFQKEFFTFVLVSYLILLLTCSILWNDKIKLNDCIISFFILIYSVVFICHLNLIRDLQNGNVLIFLPFIGAWMPDTFAYFSGKLFGKKKLIPSVSPNKTVFGSIGAILGAVITFWIYGFILCRFYSYQVNFPALLLLAFLCGIFAQLGDLSASIIKRQCNKKDFGNLIPGHGGLLDRVDSLIFVAPLVYYYLMIAEVILL